MATARYTLHVYSRGYASVPDCKEAVIRGIPDWRSLMWYMRNYGIAEIEHVPHSSNEYFGYLPDGFHLDA